MTDDDDTAADLERPERSLVGETDRRSYLGALMLAPLSGAGATTAATAATPSEVRAAVQQATANTYGEGGYGEGTYGGTDVPQYVLDYLDDASNIVETAGLQTAITDFQNDTLTAAQLRVVMSYWAAGTVVT